MLAFFQTPLRVKMYEGNRWYHKLVNQDFFYFNSNICIVWVSFLTLCMFKRTHVSWLKLFISYIRSDYVANRQELVESIRLEVKSHNYLYLQMKFFYNKIIKWLVLNNILNIRCSDVKLL